MKSVLQHLEFKNKKGSLGMLFDIILFVAVITIVGILVFTLTNDARSDLTAGSAGSNATIEADKGISKIFNNLDLIGTAAAFGAVLYIILRVIPRQSGGGF